MNLWADSGEFLRRSVNGLAAVMFSLMVYSTAMAGPVLIDTIPIGNPGNASDMVTGLGSVGYEYRIGKYEVTNAEYSAFLNNVAATDTYELYDSRMNSSIHGGIVRSGSSGSYTYSTKSGMENKPVNFVLLQDAFRFANWLDNGQPIGLQDALTTEDGAYTLNGAVLPQDLVSVTRNAGATWWLPSIDEWYKAAYHMNDGVTGNYWVYPTSSDSPPNNSAPPGGSNSANYWPTLGTVSDVGAFVDAASAYGTFDQGGNVWEQNDSLSLGNVRTIRGGSWSSFDFYLASDFSSVFDPTNPGNDLAGIGFRVATVAVPEPTSLTLAAVGAMTAIGIALRRRKRS